MLFNFKYKGSSTVRSDASQTALSFVPDARRDPTWFHGKIREKLIFREAISALHDVVVSDLRFRPKDREEYQRWLAEQEDLWLTEAATGQSERTEKIASLSQELKTAFAAQQGAMGPFYKARSKYWQHLYKTNRDWWLVLDPVISIHPDQIFFECFSEDESTYACLSCNHEAFQSVGEFACGTTNIDYSAGLYDEFQKIRDYKDTSLTIDPDGFSVQTAEDESHREVKIDLPDTWVRGFLQVSSAATLDADEMELHPMDLHNICFILKRKKEKKGPRSLRFILKPGQPVKIIVDPWNLEINCPRSIYLGTNEQEVRIWGRRRLLTLERLIPHARSVKVRLLGYGMPSFWMIDLGLMTYTLGLSGWTANNWSDSGNFDLLAPRGNINPEIATIVLQELRKDWRATSQALAQNLSLPHEDILAALSTLTQAGRAIFDLPNQVWRARELSRDPLPLDSLRFSNEREAEAWQIFQDSAISAKAEPRIEGIRLSGKISNRTKRSHRKKSYQVEALLDPDNRLTAATCTCNFFRQNKLRLGPCEHILALRLAHSRRGQNYNSSISKPPPLP
ncbi:MAG: hypothetical protein ACJAQT_001559 [Akkermansiaceae bacterium]|jgi:hypothetical protein